MVHNYIDYLGFPDSACLVYAVLGFFLSSSILSLFFCKLIGKEYTEFIAADVSKFLAIITLSLASWLVYNLFNTLPYDDSWNFGLGQIIFCNNLFSLTYWKLAYQIAMVLFVLAIFCIIGIYSSFVKQYHIEAEIDFLVMLTLFAGIMLTMVNDFITAYLCIELQTISIFALIVLFHYNLIAAEVGIKYFILSAISSALLLFGIVIVYYIFGSTNFSHLFFINHMAEKSIRHIFFKAPEYILLLKLGIALIVISLLFKLTAAPFNFWIVEIYNKSSLKAAVILAIIPKFSIFAILNNVIFTVFHNSLMIVDWLFIIKISAYLSVIIGTVGAFYYNKIISILALGGISHIGIILFTIYPVFDSTYPFLPMQTIAVYGTLYYLIAYSLAFLIFFSFLFNARIGVKPFCYMKQLSGLGIINQPIALVLTLAMASLAGLPPLIGFLAKFFIFFQAIGHHKVLGVLALFMISLISSAYYIRFIKIIWFDPLPEMSISSNMLFNLPFLAQVITAVLTFLLIVLGLYPLLIFKYSLFPYFP